MLRSFVICSLGKASPGDVVSFGDHWLEDSEGGFAGTEHAYEVLRCIIRMRHDRVESGEIVAAHIHRLRAEERLKRQFADAEVEAKDSRAIEVRDALIIIVRGSERREWQLVV